MQIKNSKKISLYFYNGSKYDNSIILKSLSEMYKDEMTMKCIGNSCEQFFKTHKFLVYKQNITKIHLIKYKITIKINSCMLTHNYKLQTRENKKNFEKNSIYNFEKNKNKFWKK